MPTTRLIINADDYGRSAPISRGIREAHLHGVVSSTTCLMNMPDIEQEIETALRETPGLGLGVHLTLTLGRPVLPAAQLPSLTNAQGIFMHRDEFVKMMPRLDMQVVKAEWKAQIEKFIAIAGKKPTHLDSHHHTAFFSVHLLLTLLECAREYELPVRLSLPHGQYADDPVFPDELAEGIENFVSKILAEHQPRCPDALFTSFHGNHATHAEFMRILSHLLPGGCYEMMCHPGYVDEGQAPASSYHFERRKELEILTHPAIRQALERKGLNLVDFSRV